MDIIALMETWRINIGVRANDMDTWARIYKLIFWCFTITNSACTAAVPLISVYFLPDSEYSVAGVIVMFCCEVVSFCLIVLDLLIKPRSSGDKCFDCLKGYSELYREISADILKHKNQPLVSEDYYFYLAARYSARERRIVGREPLILLYKRNHFEVINYIHDHNKSKIERFRKWLSDKIYSAKDEDEKEKIINEINSL